MTLKIPVGSIPKEDAIREARYFMAEIERQMELNPGKLIEFPLVLGQIERLAKVLFIGIGELSK